MSVPADFFESHVADLDDVVNRLDAAAGVEAFAEALADLIEQASSFVTVPVQVDGDTLVVRTEAGPFRLTVTREGTEALPRE